MADIQELPTELIDRPQSPDRLEIDPDHINELMESIREIGLQIPISVRPLNGRYEIIAGDCRFHAIKKLGWEKIPALIQDVDDEKVSILRATENLQRKNLSVIEEAKIYLNLKERYNLTWEQIGRKVGKSPANVKRRVDLLALPECLIRPLHEGRIGYSSAEELARLGDENKIKYYLDFALDHGATRSVISQWVRDEQERVRTDEYARNQGLELSSPYETKPVYVACDLCQGPMEIGSETILRVCSDCVTHIKKNLL